MCLEVLKDLGIFGLANTLPPFRRHVLTSMRHLPHPQGHSLLALLPPVLLLPAQLPSSLSESPHRQLLLVYSLTHLVILPP